MSFILHYYRFVVTLQNMKRNQLIRAILLLVFMAFVGGASAQTPLYLMNTSGAMYSFVLEEKPRFWHSSSLLHIKTENLKINFVLNKVSQIFWDNDIPTSIKENVEEKAKFRIDDNKLYISGAPATEIFIYSLKGNLCARIEATDSEQVVDITEFEAGTYLVKADDFTFKFIKR